ncbi:hypothetical protein FRC02_002954 [Tulasnella sp. 418]|nr:hypothetical protein FRC02_002954 [Tulasnella sp. 418]
MTTPQIVADDLQMLIQKLMQENTILRRDNMSLRKELMWCKGSLQSNCQDTLQRVSRYRDSTSSLVPIRDYNRWTIPTRSSRSEPSLPVITRISKQKDITSIPDSHSLSYPIPSTTPQPSEAQVDHDVAEETETSKAYDSVKPASQAIENNNGLQYDEQDCIVNPTFDNIPVPVRPVSIKPSLVRRSALRGNTYSRSLQSTEENLSRIDELPGRFITETVGAKEVGLAFASPSRVLRFSQRSYGEAVQNIAGQGIEAGLLLHQSQPFLPRSQEIIPYTSRFESSSNILDYTRHVAPKDLRDMEDRLESPPNSSLGLTVSEPVMEELSFDMDSNTGKTIWPSHSNFEGREDMKSRMTSSPITSYYSHLGTPSEAQDVNGTWGDWRGSHQKTWHSLAPSSPASSFDRQKNSPGATDAHFHWQSDYPLNRSPASIFSNSDASYFTSDASVLSTPISVPRSHFSDYSSDDGKANHRWFEGMSAWLGNAFRKRSYGKIKKIIPGFFYQRRSSRHSTALNDPIPKPVSLEWEESGPGVSPVMDMLQEIEPQYPASNQILTPDSCPPSSATRIAAGCGSRFIEHIDSHFASTSFVDEETIDDGGSNDTYENDENFLPPPSPAIWFAGKL